MLSLLEKESYKYQVEEMPAEYLTQQVAQFQTINKYGDIFTVFDDLEASLGVPPSMNQYCEEYVARAKEFFTTDLTSSGTKFVSFSNGNCTIHKMFNWGPDLEKAVLIRGQKSYQSLMVERLALARLIDLYPEAKFITGGSLDTVFGADVVMELDGKLIYIHVLSSTSWSKVAYEKKKKRIPRINGKAWVRDWNKAHSCLYFDKEGSDRTGIVNGNAVMTDEYIKRIIDGALSKGNYELSNEFNSLDKFKEFMANANMDNDWEER